MTRRPREMIVTWSQMSWISARMWLDTSTVTPAAASSRTRSRISRIPAGSRPLAGSSRISSSGLLSSAEATASRCFMPSE